jgi:hypothetical protein
VSKKNPPSLAHHGLITSIINQTGDDTETLNILEGHIQAGFKDGLPPHLLPTARSVEYRPGSEQSAIFVSSSDDFSRLEDTAVQDILRRRVMLVHDNQFDYNYGWNLKSFARLYDVDKKISVLGENSIFFLHKTLLTFKSIQFHHSSIPTSLTFDITRVHCENFIK